MLALLRLLLPAMATRTRVTTAARTTAMLERATATTLVLVLVLATPARVTVLVQVLATTLVTNNKPVTTPTLVSNNRPAATKVDAEVTATATTATRPGALGGLGSLALDLSKRSQTKF
jgi:hypothetical protein